MRAAGRLFFIALGLLAGCASQPAPPAVPHPLDGRIWDARAGRFVGEDDLVRQLRAARYRLLGEVHDHPEHHLLRARLLAGLGRPAPVYFEQFDLPHDAALRSAQRAGADADALARAGGFDAAWNWPLYRPLVQAALAAGSELRAANLSRAEARRIASSGTLGPDDAALAGALATAAWTGAQDAALRQQILESHCNALPASRAPAMALAQRARDAALALALAGAPADATLAAGNGHVRRDLAVPLYLPRDVLVLSVGFVETRGDMQNPDDYARGVGDAPAYDFLWFTPPHPRPDPCASLFKR